MNKFLLKIIKIKKNGNSKYKEKLFMGNQVKLVAKLTSLTKFWSIMEEESNQI